MKLLNGSTDLKVVFAIILLVVWVVFPLVMFARRQNNQNPPEKAQAPLPEQWETAGKKVHYRLIDIEGHRYLITIRDGFYSENASTIHAASCPCLIKKEEGE